MQPATKKAHGDCSTMCHCIRCCDEAASKYIASSADYICPESHFDENSGCRRLLLVGQLYGQALAITCDQTVHLPFTQRHAQKLLTPVFVQLKVHGFIDQLATCSQRLQILGHQFNSLGIGAIMGLPVLTQHLRQSVIEIWHGVKCRQLGKAAGHEMVMMSSTSQAGTKA